MKISLFQGLYTPQLCQQYPDWLFLFGDNLAEKGKKGQAVIRDEPNAFGIPTKVKPTLENSAFFKDYQPVEISNGCGRKNILPTESIIFAFSRLVSEIVAREKYSKPVSIVIPTDPQYVTDLNPHGISIGCGLAQLPERAPETWNYLLIQFQALIDAAEAVDHFNLTTK